MKVDCQVLVVGAGYLGSRLLARLPAGSAVGLKRGAPTDSRQRILEVDLDHDLPELPVVQSIVYTVPPASGTLKDVRLAHLLRGVRVAPKRIVYISTSGVYGDCGGALVDESARLNPATSRAHRRQSAEQQLEKWCKRRSVELSILRVPGIYGPQRLRLDRIRAADPVLCEADAGPANRIHVDDLVSCALAALDPGRPAGIFNVGDGNYRSSTWFSHTVAELAGLPPPPEISLAEARRQFSAMRWSFLKESRKLDVHRMLNVLGVSLAYPDAREGIRACLQGEDA